MTIAEFLASPLYRGQSRPTVLERVAELVVCNGGFRVHGWGYIDGRGPYGRLGLEMEEALELIELEGILNGFALASNNSELAWGEIHQAVREEIDRHVERQRTQYPAEAAP